MGRYKYLFKNIGILTLSSFATKLISFFLVPLYTNILSVTEYGTYDLFNTTVGVLLPLLTLNIQEAVLRFSLDNKFSRESIVTIATKYLLISNVIVILGLGINSIFGFSQVVRIYAIYFFLMFFSQVLSSMVTMYIRGIDKIIELSISSVIASFITICCNILFLVFFNWGIKGYFLANIFGPLVQCAYLILKAHMISSIRFNQDFTNEKIDMVKYSKPLITNSIAWWVNNAADRYIIIMFCGLAENGIYSVASKIPSILNIFQAIFNQAWSLSAVRDFNSEDEDGFFANTYRVYNCVMVIICSCIIISTKIIAKLLYANDFFIAWKYVPWLTIAILFGAMSGYIGGFFSAVKDTKIFAKSTLFGAITNIGLNLILVPSVGGLGASVATAISYFEIWVFRYIHSKKYIKLKVNLFRDSISYGILVIQSIVILIDTVNYILYSIEIVLFVLIALLYRSELLLILNKGKK